MNLKQKDMSSGTSLMIRLHAFTAGGMGLIPGQGSSPCLCSVVKNYFKKRNGFSPPSITRYQPQDPVQAVYLLAQFPPENGKKKKYIYSICPIYHMEIVGINTENTLYESFMIVKYMQTMDRKITLQIQIKIAQRSVND